jgi:hypothetical protein
MKAKMRFENPDVIEATLSITMSVKEWKLISNQLSQDWPSDRINQAIYHVIREAGKAIDVPEKNVL